MIEFPDVALTPVLQYETGILKLVRDEIFSRFLSQYFIVLHLYPFFSVAILLPTDK